MPLPIEDYGLIGDCHTAALVGCDGSIDWLCLPRFDSGACFAALLGAPEHGRWLIAPIAEVRSTRRRYRGETLILETELETETGTARIIDFMPLSNERWDVVRIVEGLRGAVAMRMELIVRFDYGSIVPWVRHAGDTLIATAGPDTLELFTRVAVRGEHVKSVAEFHVGIGERITFTLNYRPSHEASRNAVDPIQALEATEKEWRAWSGRCTYSGRWRDAVVRSLITLKALTYAPTGGIVAAPTTSLPEQQGGVRNWDYRYCWIRDATFTLNALLLAGYHEEAVAWREWLLRAAAGCPEDLQILYSVTGERRLVEYDVRWLQRPDQGIWEVRGPCRHFTHSKVMAWVAFDRAVKAVDVFGLDGPAVRWRAVRDAIHAQVCADGYDARTNTFVQFYGSPHVNASLLLIPQVGFLPPDDVRVRGTIEAVERDLVVDGLVLRYSTATGVDALPAGEGTFLPCSFWLVDSLLLVGRREEAEALFERLLALSNDLGLLAEEYDPHERNMLGNFPQALTHMALINSARLLSMSAQQARAASEKGERPAAAANIEIEN